MRATNVKVGSTELDTGGWEALGSTDNADHFLMSPGVMVTIYRPGSRDNEKTARGQLRFQQEYVQANGGGFALIVLIDNLVTQDAASRRVYAKEPDPKCFRGTALVGGTMLSRGVASFFLGISRTAVPMKFFPTISDATDWFDRL